jgi:hypothetical protein
LGILFAPKAWQCTTSNRSGFIAEKGWLRGIER